jgi:hypothetical protein
MVAEPGRNPYLDAALHYRDCGLSVFPIEIGTKGEVAVPSWNVYRQRLPTDIELRSWFYSPRNIAIVCGPSPGTSDELVVLDIDDIDFADYVEHEVLPRLTSPTWTVRSGRGAIHLYLYSSGVTPNTVLHGGGRKLADIKGSGGYVLAPPSIHRNGNTYTTITGGPDQVAHTLDAMATFQLMADRWSGTITPPHVGRRTRPLEAGGSDYTVRAAAPPERAAELRNLINGSTLSGKIKRAILNGAPPGLGEWGDHPDNSDVAITVLHGLMDRGWRDFDLIEELFATFPIGAPCYRNLGRSNYGRGWLQIEHRNAYAKWEREQDQHPPTIAESNFTVERIVRLFPDAEDAIYEFHCHSTLRDQEGMFVMSLADCQSITKFKQAFYTRFAHYPEMIPAHQGKAGHENFLTLVGNIASVESTPPAASTEGNLDAIVREILSGPTTGLVPPLSVVDMRIAFEDEASGFILVRGSALLRQVSFQLRPSPTPPRIWRALRRLGGRTYIHRYPQGGQEELWAVPLTTIRRWPNGQVHRG